LSPSESTDPSPPPGPEAAEANQGDTWLEDRLIPLKACLEALLFVAAGPVPVSRLAESLDASLGDVEAALQELREQYQGTGLQVQRHHSGMQLTTSPEVAAVVARFLESERTTSLSRAALETLAIVAYKQPATRPQIDAIRGVSSESAVHTLLRYGLIVDAGRSDSPGRPILYKTTPDFLGYFGVSSLDDLPPIPEEAPGAEGGPAGHVGGVEDEGR
jgi:segregation and condensation protein B